MLRAELTTYVIRVDNNDMEARRIKAQALRQLGFKTMNINWRNWYLTSARELDGVRFDHSRMVSRAGIVRALPTGVKIESMALRLAAERTLDLHMTMGFRLPDLGEDYAIEIRRGVAQFHSICPDKVDVALILDEPCLGDILVGRLSFEEGLKTGKVKVEGRMEDVVRFFGCFEKPKRADKIFLTLTNGR
jgi:alkyl sulfatase BDS1-like metallo-beta-lactamase superfamily hydrolase